MKRLLALVLALFIAIPTYAMPALAIEGETTLKYIVVPQEASYEENGADIDVTYTVKAEVTGSNPAVYSMTFYILPPELLKIREPLMKDGLFYHSQYAPNGKFEVANLAMGTGEHKGKVVGSFAGATAERNLGAGTVDIGTFIMTIPANSVGTFAPTTEKTTYGDLNKDTFTAVADITPVVVTNPPITSVTVTAPDQPVKFTPLGEASVAQDAPYTVSTAWDNGGSVAKVNTKYTATVTVTAKENYKFGADIANSTPAGFSSIVRTSDTVLTLVKDDYANTADREISSIKIAGNNSITVSQEKKSVDLTLTVNGTYDDETTAPVTASSWTTEPAALPNGVTFEGGKLTVAYNAEVNDGDTIKLTATAGEKTSSPYTVTIVKPAAEPKSIVLTPSTNQSVTIPSNGDEANTVAVSAKVYDQYGKTNDTTVEWSISPENANVKFADGKFTVSAGAEAKTYTLTATAGKAENTLTFELSKKLPVTFTNFADTTVKYKESYSFSATPSEEGGILSYKYAAADGTELSSKPVNAGTYKVTAHYVSTTHEGSATITLTIEPKEVNVELASAEPTRKYNGNPLTVTATPTGILPEDAKSVTVKVKYKDTYDAPVNVGTYNGITAEVSENANYKIGTVTGTTSVTINPKPVAKGEITLLTTGITKAYDGDNKVKGDIKFKFTGAGSDGEITVTAKNNTYNDETMGTGKAITLGDISGEGLSNYSISEYPAVTGSITEKAATYVIKAHDDVVYDGTNNYADHTATVTDDLSYTIKYKLASEDDSAYTAAKPVNAGTYNVRAVISDTHYSLSGEPATFEIKKKPVEAKDVTVEPAFITKPYDGNNNVKGDIQFKFAGAGSDGEITVTATGNTYDNANAGKNKTITAGTKTEPSNYTVTYPVVKGEIQKKDISYEASPLTVTYSGTNTYTDPTATLKDYVGTTAPAYAIEYKNGDSWTAEKPVNAGDYVFRAVLKNEADKNNYNLTGEEIALKIEPKTVSASEVTVEPASITKTYDGNNKVIGDIRFKFAGVGNDGEITVTATGNTYDDANKGEDKAITIGTKTEPSNYTVTYPDVKGDITAKTVDVTITGTDSAVYGDSTFTHSASAELGSDSSNYTIKYKEAKASGFVTKNNVKNAGTYTVIAEMDNTNYVANVLPFTFTIQKKPVDAELDKTDPNTADIKKTYDGENTYPHDIKFKITGIPEDGEFTAWGKDNTFQSVNAGTNIVINSATLSGAGLDNYDVKYPTVTGKIEQRELTYTINAHDNVIYNGKSDYADHTSAIENYVGATAPAYTIEYKLSTEDDSAYKPAKPVNAGTYNVRAVLKNEADKNNYTLKGTEGTFTIDKAPVPNMVAVKEKLVRYNDTAKQTVTPADFKIDSAFAGTFSDVSAPVSEIIKTAPSAGNNLEFFIKTLTEADVDKEATYTAKFVPENKNYKDTDVTLKIRISAKDERDVTVSIPDFQYGNEMPVKTLSPAGSANWTFAYNTKGGADVAGEPTVPGTYIVTATYEDESSKGVATDEFEILKRDVAISGLTVSDKVYNNTVKAEITGTLKLEGILEADKTNVTAPTISKAEFADVNVGENKDVTVTLTSASGSMAERYNIPASVTLKGRITKPSAPVIMDEDDPLKAIEEKTVDSEFTSYADAIKTAWGADAAAFKTKLTEKVKTDFPALNNVYLMDVQLKVSGTENHDVSISFMIPYPAGAKKGDSFKVAHILQNGTLEYIAEANVVPHDNGLIIKNTTTSPFAISWKVITPPSSSGSDRDSYIKEENNFWDTVVEEIENAEKGDVLKLNTKKFDKLSWEIMDALRHNPTVSLVIDWDGGNRITIPAGKALAVENGRIFYPLSYLEKVYSGSDIKTDGTPSVPAYNPATGGLPVYIEANIPKPSTNIPTITPSVTPMDEGIITDAVIVDKTPVKPSVPPVIEEAEENQESGRNLFGAMAAFAVAFIALAIAIITIIKRRRDED